MSKKTWVLALSLPLALVSYASGVGMGVSKTCPPTPQTIGVQFQCSYNISNTDPVNTVTGITVTNKVPCNNPPTCTGSSSNVITPCATTLQPQGQQGDNCSGTLNETATDCSVGALTDFLLASGTANGQAVGGGAAGSTDIIACTPTPTNTPTRTPTFTATNTPTNTPTSVNTATNTPTNTPTSTPTNTPTRTPTSTPTNTPPQTAVVVPTLSFPMLGLLAAALMGAALWVMKRR